MLGIDRVHSTVHRAQLVLLANMFIHQSIFKITYRYSYVHLMAFQPAQQLSAQPHGTHQKLQAATHSPQSSSDPPPH